MRNAHGVTKDFEAALCEYTGAPYAVAVNSCTMALTLAVAWHLRGKKPYCEVCGWQPVIGEQYECARSLCGWMNISPPISIPNRTYVSVPMAIIHAGGRPTFHDEDWRGCYQLTPLPVWDCARWFTSSMYYAWMKGNHQMQCVSFHASKTLGDTQGGAILHDNAEADAWFRRARFDGRAEGVAPKDDTGLILGWHCYLSPDVSARLLNKLHFLPRHNEPLPNDDYPDLSTLECFR